MRILCTDRKGDTPIIALVYDANYGQEYGYAFYSDGKFFRDENKELDLFFAPEKHEGWINSFRGKDSPFTGNIIFASKEEAEESGRHCCGFTKDLYMTSAKIEWEE